MVVIPPLGNLKQTDFTPKNQKVLLARKGRLAGSHRKPGRIHGNDQYIFDSLRQEISQLRDLLGFIKAGNLYHAAGIAARLRLLIIAGDPLPLLQLCAATLDKPLIMFTAGSPMRKLSLPIEPQFR